MENSKQKKKWPLIAKIILWGLGIFIAIGIIAVATGGSDDKTDSDTSSAAKEIGLGQTLHTRYFAVRVNKAYVSSKVSTGDEYADLPQESGNQYLIIELDLKNTDNESRMMFDGEIHIMSKGREMKYEQAETVAADGWNIIVDNINPGVTKRTKLAYKIPANISGKAYYYPARSGDGDRIFLTNL